MKYSRRPSRHLHHTPRLKARPGIALFVAMFMVVGIGALALSAIYLTANSTLISKSYEKEDNLRYAAEAAIAIGRADLNYNPSSLPAASFDTLLMNYQLRSADGKPVDGISVNLYLGQTGATSGQFGTFASLVADARDGNGNGFVRRLEMTQESFAKFAYWTNSEKSGGTTIYFGSNDQLWGPVWSNDTLSIDVTHATFHDSVGTVGIVVGGSNAVFARGYKDHQKPILLPTLSKLAALEGYSTGASLDLTSPTVGGASGVLMRLDFVATDLNADTDSLDDNEGFVRIYTANTGNQAWLRGDWPGSKLVFPSASSVRNCGDWHLVSGVKKFFPYAVHGQRWFDTVTAMPAGGTAADWDFASIPAAHVHDSVTTVPAGFTTLLQTSPYKIQCFLGGDPHLVAVARTTTVGSPGYDIPANVHKGGDDTTFTAIDQYGSWTAFPTPPDPLVLSKRPADASYLYPLFRGFNPGSKGVIYVSGTVGISGTLRSDVTLYSPHSIIILDDLRYANAPEGGQCVDVMGIIAGENVVVADNGLNTPQYVKTGIFGAIAKSMDDTPDLYLHGVIMALGSFSVENYSTGPNNTIGCDALPNGRGCLFLTGGVIQNVRGAVGQASGTGFIKRYSYDRCAAQNPPPYFPTTGRFADNRFYEIDPVNFNIAKLFKSLSAP